MFLLYHSCLQNFKKIKDQLLFYQTNVKISKFCDLKLYIKNKFIDRIINKIQFKRNLICMLRIWEIWNSTIKILNFIPKNKLHNKFEEFHRQQKSQFVNGTLHAMIYEPKKKHLQLIMNPPKDPKSIAQSMSFQVVQGATSPNGTANIVS